MIFKSNIDILRRNQNNKLQEFSGTFYLGLVTQGIVFVAWICMNIMPKYTTYFKTVSPPYAGKAASEISSFKILCYISDVLLIISWFVASAYNKAGIDGLDLDPEDDNKDPSKVGESTDVEKQAMNKPE